MGQRTCRERTVEREFLAEREVSCKCRKNNGFEEKCYINIQIKNRLFDHTNNVSAVLLGVPQGVKSQITDISERV